MTKLRLLVILFLASAPLAWSQKDDCSMLKTGRFYVLTNTDTCFIERFEKRQIERCGENEETKYILIWITECKYVIRDMEYNPTTAEKIMKNDVVMTVLEVYPTYHLVKMKQQGHKKKYIKVYHLDLDKREEAP